MPRSRRATSTSTDAAWPATRTSSTSSTRCSGTRGNGPTATARSTTTSAASRRYVQGGLDRHATRGLAIFACSASDLWEVIELPMPVRTQVVINHAPAVGQLEAVVQEHEPIGVLLADRQRARLLVFEQGELVERTELIDELPRDVRHPRRARARHRRRATSTSWPTSTCATRPGPPSTSTRPARLPAPRDRRARTRSPASSSATCTRTSGAAVRAGPASAVGASDAEVRDGRRGGRGRGRARNARPSVVARLREAAITGRRGRGRARPHARGAAQTAGSSASWCPRATPRRAGAARRPGRWRWSAPPTRSTARRWSACDDVVEDAIEEALTQGLPGHDLRRQRRPRRARPRRRAARY